MPPIKLFSRIVYFLLDLVVLLLAARLLLRLFGANASAGFSRFVLQMTDPLMAPFTGLLPPTRFAASSVDWSVLIAMAVYILATVLLVRFIRLMLAPQPSHRVVATDVEEDFHEEE